MSEGARTWTAGEPAAAAGEAGPEALSCLDRPSDPLFILARSVQGTDEALWQPWSRR